MSARSAFRPMARALPRAPLLRSTTTNALRPYATSAGQSGGAGPKFGSSSKTWIVLGTGVVAVVGGYVYNNSQMGAYMKFKEPNLELDYQAVYNDIAEVLDADEYDDGSFGPVLVRLAWHASGTYDKETGTGGSNGATMRFVPESDHGANAGLSHARDRLEPIYKKYAKQGLTYSDLWTLAGACAVQEMGGPIVPWRPGRKDGLEADCTPDGRLPDGDKGQDHIRKIFYRMGFNDQEIVALLGAHALGRCHTDRSGFDGPWTFSPTTVTNDYYKLLFNEKWQQKKWGGPPQYEDTKTKSLMMLIPDMALTKDKSFKTWAKKYADDESAWFTDFSKAFAKLMELGVPAANFGDKQPMHLKKVEEQAKV